MNTKHLLIVALLVAGSAAPAAAACPAPMAGDTAEALAANQQRLICLQRELARNGEEYQYKVQINTIEQSLDRLQLQRRFDSLDFSTPVVPGF